MSLVNESIQYENKNFWEVNPQLVYMPPFSSLYSNDKSKNKEKSSKDMWCIFFMSDPDEEKNKFFRITEDKRLDMLKEVFHPEFDENDELILTCLNTYPHICLSSVERALKAEKEALAKRAKFLQEADYNYDTMKDLDNAYSKTSKIYENFEVIEERFMKQKNQARVRGGRRETASERGEI
jgi:hypothetical protein